MKTIPIQTNIPDLADTEEPLAGVSLLVTRTDRGRSVDIDGVLLFTLSIASGISTSLVANWLYDRFRKHTSGTPTKRFFLRISYSQVDYTNSRAIEKALQAELEKTTEEQE